MMQKLFLVFVFLLPLQTAYLLREPFVGGAKWEYGIVAIYGTDILLLLVFVFPLFRKIKERIKNQEFRIKIPPLADSLGMMNGILMILVAWAGVSIFWASDQMLAVYFFVKLLLASGLFFTVRLIEIDMKKVVFVLLAAGVVQSGIGIAQFLSQHSISSSILGISSHDVSVAGSSVLKIDSGRFLRAYGTFPHPNILGGFLGVILVLCISYYVSGIKEKESYKLQVTSYKKNEIPPLEDSLPEMLRIPLQAGVGMTMESLVLIAGSMIILLGLILTFSRTAWLGVGLGVVALAMHAHFQNVTRNQRSWFRVTFLKVVGMLVFACVVFGSILHEEIFPRFDTKVIEREGSVSERIVSLQDARQLIVSHPLAGVGAGNFTAGIMEKGEKGLMGERGEMGFRPVWSIQPAHNVFILILSELGIVGFVLFVLFLVSLFKSVIPAYEPGSRKAIQESWIPGQARDDNLTDFFFKKENVIFSIALLTLIPSLFLDHWLWSSHFGILFLFLLLGLATRR